MLTPADAARQIAVTVQKRLSYTFVPWRDFWLNKLLLQDFRSVVCGDCVESFCLLIFLESCWGGRSPARQGGA